MLRARTCLVVAIGLVVLSPSGLAGNGSVGPVSAQEPAVSAVLEAAALYLDAYQKDVTAVVAEESYTQMVYRPVRYGSGTSASSRRRLTSDLATIAVPDAGWLSFRDVYEVDGEPVRDRTERLRALFVDAAADPVEQAERITEESTRFNLNGFGVSINRTINYPMMALRYLERRHHQRSRFTFEGTTRVDDLSVAEVRFAEQTLPRLIASPDSAPASGRFWIEPSTGRVVRTALEFETTNERQTTTIKSRIEVRFAPDARTGLWMPAQMNESYEVRTRSGPFRFTGTARYSNFRRFDVDTSIVIKRQR